MSKSHSHSSPRAKALAYIVTFAFIAVAVLGSGWITLQVGAAPINDPYDLSAAPHVRDVAYMLEAPSYLQRFDSLGSWKVSSGAPAVSCTDSTLTIKTSSTALAQISLYTIDAKGTNITTREYLEFKIKTSAAANAGITLSDAAGHIASVAFESNTVYSSYKDASGAIVINSAFYTSAIDGAYYRVGFTLTTSTISYYLYSENGTALANYVATAPLHAGKLMKIDLWRTGAAGTTTLDWFYTAADNPTVTAAVSASKIGEMTPDASQTKSNIGVDPSSLKMVRSGSAMANQVYGIDPNATADNINGFTQVYGSTPEPMQRIQGKQFAMGWTDFGSSLESKLKAQISLDTGAAVDDIHLVDYYVDYLQVKTSINPSVASFENDLFIAMVKEAAKAYGISTASSASGSQLSLDIIPPYAYGHMDLGGDIWNFLTTPGYKQIAGLVSAGVNDATTSAINAAGDSAGKAINGAINTAGKVANDTMKSIMAGVKPYLDQGMNLTNAVLTWMQTTSADFKDMITGNTAAMMSWSTANMGQLNNATTSALDKVTSLNQQFMTWSGQQMAATNAMFSQIFGQMNDQMNATQQYFSGQLMKSNEALTNVTSSLNGMWSSVLDGGKASTSTPLTLSGLFGTGLLGNSTFVIVLVAIVIVAMVGLIIFLKGNGRRSRR